MMKKIKKILYILIVSLMASLSLISCAKKEKKKEPIKEVYTIPFGDYQDRQSKRATMTVSFKNRVYCFEINWASSASENTKWVFSGVYDIDLGGIRYDNEICLNEVYDEEGNVESAEVYHEGKGKMIYKDNMLYWDDEQEEKSDGKDYNAIFEKLNYEG